jgi:hypothetical protein
MNKLIAFENSDKPIDRGKLSVADANGWIAAANIRLSKANRFFEEANKQRAGQGLPPVPLIPPVALIPFIEAGTDFGPSPSAPGSSPGLPTPAPGTELQG